MGAGGVAWSGGGAGGFDEPPDQEYEQLMLQGAMEAYGQGRADRSGRSDSVGTAEEVEGQGGGQEAHEARGITGEGGLTGEQEGVGGAANEKEVEDVRAGCKMGRACESGGAATARGVAVRVGHGAQESRKRKQGGAGENVYPVGGEGVGSQVGEEEGKWTTTKRSRHGGFGDAAGVGPQSSLHPLGHGGQVKACGTRWRENVYSVGGVVVGSNWREVEERRTATKRSRFKFWKVKERREE